MRLNRISTQIEFDRIDESMLYFSPKFRKVLSSIDDSDIANGLLEVELDDVKPDLTFIDFSEDKPDYISFTQIRNADNKIKKVHSDMDVVKGERETDNETDRNLISKGDINFLYNNDINNLEISTGVFTKSRNDLKLGKLVNKIWPGKFTSAQIEDFVNKFRSKIEKEGEEFQLVSGKDVSKYYLCDTYAEGEGGSLNSSCMRYRNTQSYISWYEDNPESVNLLVLFDEDKKVLGRALVWKLHEAKDENYDYLMDRIYYINDSDVDKFKDYAKSKGWAYKSRQSMDCYDCIEFNGEEEFNDELKVKMKKPYYYPYMDTFQFYDYEDEILYNDESIKNETSIYILNDTAGGHTQGGLWSDMEDGYIHEDDAVYSEYHGTYLRVDHAVMVRVRYGEDWVHPDYARYSEYADEHFMEDETVYSEKMEDYLYEEDAIKVIIDDSGSTDWFHQDMEDEEYHHIDDSYYHIDLVTPDINSEPLLKKDAEKVYFTDGETGMSHIQEYVSEFWADYMDMKVDEDDTGYIKKGADDKVIWVDNSLSEYETKSGDKKKINIFDELESLRKEASEIKKKYKYGQNKDARAIFNQWGIQPPKSVMDRIYLIDEVYKRLNKLAK